jgi:hypothetical protein
MSPATITDVRSWFIGRLPDAWFHGPPEVRVDQLRAAMTHVEQVRAEGPDVG